MNGRCASVESCKSAARDSLGGSEVRSALQRGVYDVIFSTLVSASIFIYSRFHLYMFPSSV